MKVAFTFKHVDGHDTIRAHAEEKSEKLRKFVSHPIDLHFFVTQENGSIKTEITFLADHGRYAAEAHDARALTSVDMAMDRLEVQLRKHKDKQKNHHH